jgi:hypothetical protein
LRSSPQRFSGRLRKQAGGAEATIWVRKEHLMNRERHAIPLPTDLGPDPEPLGSERYDPLFAAATRPRPVRPRPRRVIPLHPLAVIPGEWADAEQPARRLVHA